MNNSTAVFLLNDKVRCVQATYETGDHAPKTLFKTVDQTIVVDDLVIVPTNTRHCFTVVKVTAVDVEFDIDTPTNMEWVVSKLDKTGHETLLAQEAEAISMIRSAEKRKKKEALREAVFADQSEKLRALPIAHAGDDTPKIAS